MHILSDDDWLTGKEILALLRIFICGGSCYQMIDVKKMPFGSATKIYFYGDHSDLIRLQIQLYEALGEHAYLRFFAAGRLEVPLVGYSKGTTSMVLIQHLDLSLCDCMALGDAISNCEVSGGIGSGFIMGSTMP